MNHKKLKIGIFTGTRAEYGLLHPIIKALHDSENFTPVLYVSGAHLDVRYGSTLNEIKGDGFSIDMQFPLSELGSNMASESGLLAQQLGQALKHPQNRPDCILLLGDRYETLGVAMGAFLSNIPLAHIHGGDVVRGGMLDDSIRHAITKLAHLHFPVTETSAKRILAMGEENWRVTVVGSPAIDNMRSIPVLDKAFFAKSYNLSLQKPWILFTQHSITTQPELAETQVKQTLSAIASFGDSIEVIATYPNQDEGSLAIIEQLKHFGKLPQFKIFHSLGRVHYLNLLRHVTVVIGNSSSGLLETAHFQAPCINVGERQKGRERGENVMDVPQDEEAILNALKRILQDEQYRSKLQQGAHPFGDGQCAVKILETFQRTRFDQNLLQKQLTY